MFEKIDMQYGTESQVAPKSDKNLVLSFSLLMRLFEWCHEDAKDDVAMHKVMEKLVAFSDGRTPLTIDCYEAIIADAPTKDDKEEPKKAGEDEILSAGELGSCLANVGVDLSSIEYSDIAPVINQVRGEEFDGYGSSNAELESFWNGYEGKPLKQGCFTEIDMNGAVKAVQDDMRANPTTITFGEEPCEQCCCGEECLDDETIKQINQVINAGKF